MKRRTFLIGSLSGLSLLAVSACTPQAPTPSPTVPVVPSRVPQPAAFVRTRWLEDPFARGAFSFQRVGSSPDDRIAMRQPIGDRLFFAGEATSDVNPGTVYGARASGIRAAVEVMETAEPGERIAVVGAGVAGAAAARRLADEGFDVVVVEGRDRAGGRLHSLRDEEWPITMELGAAWVGDPATTLLADLEELGVETVTPDEDADLRGPTGTALEAAGTGRAIVEEALAWAAIQPADVSVEDALRLSGAGAAGTQPGPDGVSPEQWLEWYLQTTIAVRSAADLDELSAWFVPALPDAEQPDLDWRADQQLVVGGYDTLVTEALDGLTVLPSSAVIGITRGDEGVSLRLARGESLSAERVVLTVPLGVLQSGAIEFDPPLPFGHRGAISALGMGTVDKVLLRFDEPFWSTDATWWGSVGHSEDFAGWMNLQPLTGEPVLMSTIGGEVAERLAAYSDEEVLESALSSLEPFLDTATPAPGTS